MVYEKLSHLLIGSAGLGHLDQIVGRDGPISRFGDKNSSESAGSVIGTMKLSPREVDKVRPSSWRCADTFSLSLLKLGGLPRNDWQMGSSSIKSRLLA